jgi:hypothetical protein
VGSDRSRSIPIAIFGLCAWTLPCAYAASPAAFVEVAEASGIQFVHIGGHTAEKYMIETLGSGVCFLDYDGDGLEDLYFVQSGTVPGRQGPKVSDALYRNLGGGRFADVTAAAGIGEFGYGMGCAAGDIEGDGDVDLYVTNFGPNVLFRNNGDGTFTDVAQAAGVANPLWSASAAFADYDGDGDLDLYVANYVDFAMDNNKMCGDLPRRIRTYCHPDAYEGVPDALYRNQGDGTFRDVAAEAGLTQRYGKGLGVVWSDLDLDGDLDLYVANDSVPNALYRNEGSGHLLDVTLSSNTCCSEDGRPEAGMGVDAGDVDGDGRFDLIVTNLSGEPNELYRNLGGMTFEITTFPSGFGAVSLPFVGFGTNIFDFDNDGDQDIMVVNGHIIDNIALLNDASTYEQRPFLFENVGGGRVREVGREHGTYFNGVFVGRGLALADIDLDGDLDAAINNHDQRARLLRNEGGNALHWLRLRLQARTRGNRDGIGARAEVTAGGRRQVDEVRSGTSYGSENERALHFGLGDSISAERIDIRWPSGSRTRVEGVAADQILVIVEP